MTFKKHSKSSVMKDIQNLKKKVKKIYPMISKEQNVTDNTNMSVYTGVASSATLDTMFANLVLTSLSQAVGESNRLTNRVAFKRLKGVLNIALPDTASFAVSNYSKVRAFILKLKTVPGSIGAHTHPVYTDVFDTITPLIENSAYDPMDFNLKTKNSNYDIVWSKVFDLSLAGTHRFHCGKHEQPNGTIQNCGTGGMYQFEYDIFPKGETTYDATTNNIAACNENHYILYWGCSRATANNVPYWNINAHSEYQQI